MKENRQILEIRLDGGNLSLNFVNTIHDRYEEPLEDYLHNYLDLITWANFADAINSSQKKRLLQRSRENQEEANQVYKDSIQLREAIYQCVVSLINRDEVSAVNMQVINQWLSKAFSNLELAQLDNSFVLDWKAENSGLESVLWPIIRSFADLVTSDDRGRIKQCSNCGWVFVDNSKNKSRRWCSMETCGNRVKAQRHADKTRT
ncbi:MAG: CGNR zinc finger domain-containing protein [Anaerolineales bacterium]|jgi:predicted RNA-binding Zn ribbon-like protein